MAAAQLAQITCVQHEAVEGQKQGDLVRAAAASTQGKKWPQTRACAHGWLFCFYTYMHIMFGAYWILHSRFCRLLLIFQKDQVWVMMTARDIPVLIWGIHLERRWARMAIWHRSTQ